MFRNPDFEFVGFTSTERKDLYHDEHRGKVGPWLKDALPLEVFCSEDRRIVEVVEQLLGEIQSGRTKKFKSPVAARNALETIVINLSLASLLGQPVRYSRDRSHYSINKRFGRRNLTYKMVRDMTNGLEAHGYIRQAIGRSFYEDRDRGTQTRMWATEKLLGLFSAYRIEAPDFISKPETELIQLTRKKKEKGRGNKIIEKVVNVEFGKTHRIRKMERAVSRYNEFVDQNIITVELTAEDTVNYNILFSILKNSYTNCLTILQVIPYLPDIYKLDSNSRYTGIISTTIQDTGTTTPLPHLTQTFGVKPNTGKGYSDTENFRKWLLGKYKNINRNLGLARFYKKKEMIKRIYSKLSEKVPLKSFGVEMLIFSLNREHLHRVFCRNSFNKGGRFYGAIYQELSQNIRKRILINGERTVELDFKALHPRMLYHMKKADFQGNPYSACAGEQYKDVFKIALLISVNAENEVEAMKAIKERLREKEIPLPEVGKPLKWIIRKIKEGHPAIAEFICRDMGVVLQNKDSQMMNAILMRLMGRGILGLGIHDSIIVQERHEEALKAIMLDEYEKAMGFTTEVERK